MLAKNDFIPLTVTGVTSEGNGIGRYVDGADSGMAIFVPYTAVGDEITCRIEKVEKRFAYGRAVEIYTASADRCTDDARACAAYGQCGGCTWRHVTYEAETQYKWKKVADALTRIGGLSITPEPILSAPSPDRYRNKAQYPVTEIDGKIVVGFYAARSHRVLAQTDCALQPKIFSRIIQLCIDWMTRYAISPYHEQTGKGQVRHLYIRRGEKSGEIMVCLVATTGRLPHLSKLAQALKEHIEGFTTLVVNVNKKDTNVILGDREYTVYGDGYITDQLCGLQFKLSPRSFYQVNCAQAERLYALAKQEAALTGDEVLLDLYCGTGTIGLTMAKDVKMLVGADIVEPAIADAKENALQNGIENARFICADAAAAAAQLKSEGLSPDVVILDPPRKGCDTALIETVVQMAPSRVVYISCNPATLARDLAQFGTLGYHTARVTPVDLFPATAHCEAVAVIYKE